MTFKVVYVFILFFATFVEVVKCGSTRSINVRLVCTTYQSPGLLTPVPNIRVSLVRKSGFLYGTGEISSARTDMQGRTVFHMDIDTIRSENPLKITYDYGTEDSTHFYLANDLKRVHTEVFKLPTNVTYTTIKLRQDLCSTYLSMKAAWDDFVAVTNRTVHPCDTPLYVIPNSLVNRITGNWTYAFATTDTIRVHQVHVFKVAVAQHELAHTIRHCLDGGFAHFLLDVAWYNYARNHWCGLITNEGFAFNEGFAEYWASECIVREMDYEDSPEALESDSSEMHVAASLHEMGIRCHGEWVHRGRIFEVLEENPGAIHSLAEFVKFHKKKYNCS